jgi:hypothetical protein
MLRWIVFGAVRECQQCCRKCYGSGAQTCAPLFCGLFFHRIDYGSAFYFNRDTALFAVNAVEGPAVALANYATNFQDTTLALLSKMAGKAEAISLPAAIMTILAVR